MPKFQVRVHPERSTEILRLFFLRQAFSRSSRVSTVQFKLSSPSKPLIFPSVLPSRAMSDQHRTQVSHVPHICSGARKPCLMPPRVPLRLQPCGGIGSISTSMEFASSLFRSRCHALLDFKLLRECWLQLEMVFEFIGSEWIQP